jgi:hypothetical protein
MQDNPKTQPHAHGRGLVHTARMRDLDRAQALRALTMNESVVYALRLNGGIIKIGCSASLHNRRRFVEAGAEILAFRFGTYEDEQAIHASLVPHRARGREYYHPTAEVLAVVNDMRDDFNLPHLAA